jgi:prepilin-type N-terminal cleavage/methylation domain-containing protein
VNIKSERGFNIVEMALVLAIMGLLFAIGISMLQPLTEGIKRKATENTLEDAAGAVTGFAETNYRLPTVGEFDNVASNPKDVWGNDLVYVVDSNLTVEGSICDRSSTDIAIEGCDDPSCTSSIDAAENTAFLILSSGSNLNIQTDVASDTINTYTQDLPDIDDFTTDMNRPERFDDIVKWVVLPALRLRLGCGGSPLRILDNPLPSGVVSQSYSISIFAVGGVLFTDIDGDTDTVEDYRWCVISSLPAGLSYACNPDDGPLAVSADCDWDGSTETGTWQQCTSLGITGTPTSIGSFNLKIFARDDAGNLDDNMFVLTVSLGAGGGLQMCPEYRVWNEKPATKTDYRVRLGFELTDPITGPCDDVDWHDEVTDEIKMLEINEVLEQHMTSDASCNGLVGRLTYNNAILADTNGDCCLDFETTNVVDKTCP